MTDPGNVGQIRPAGQPYGASRSGPASRPADGSFKAAFDRELGAVNLSRHARQRLSAGKAGGLDMVGLARAVDRAAARGARDSLVVMGDLALVVNVPSRTVITAVESDRMGDQVFTNIDSAVVVRGGAGPSRGGPDRGMTEAVHAGRQLIL